MVKTKLKKPVLIYFYGFPGAGKSQLAQNLEQQLEAALISEDKIRRELLTTPSYIEQEGRFVQSVMDYMAEQFLRAGLSVIFDINTARASHRLKLRNLATKHKAEHLLIWVQIDPETAFSRLQAVQSQVLPNKATFDNQLARMQNPGEEPYVVVSGKHSFVTQKSAILSRIYQKGLVDSSVIQSGITAPGLINLVPMPVAGRIEMNRRNINIV